MSLLSNMFTKIGCPVHYRLSCINTKHDPSSFRSRNQFNETSTLDDIHNILIFGVTGMTGGAVLDATLGCGWFKVSGFTRARSGKTYDELVAKGVTVFSGDMNKPQSIRNTMKGIDTVFLVTSYWDSRSAEAEYSQGVNVVNVAIENSVKHLIYVGTDYSMSKAVNKCSYLEGKSMIENYIVSVGIPFTILHLGFFYENLLSVFKPYRTGKAEFALALPMGKTPLNWGSVIDFGCCVGKLALQPEDCVYRIVNLATAYMTVSEMVINLDLHFSNVIFYDPLMTLNEYAKLDLQEARELVTMFAHYHTVKEWDRSLTYKLFPSWRSVNQWIRDNETNFLSILSFGDFSSNMQKMSRDDGRKSMINMPSLPNQMKNWLQADGFVPSNSNSYLSSISRSFKMGPSKISNKKSVIFARTSDAV